MPCYVRFSDGSHTARITAMQLSLLWTIKENPEIHIACQCAKGCGTVV